MGTCLLCKTTFNETRGGKKYCSEKCIYEANNLRRRKTEKRKIWDGDKKICIDCGVAKDVSEYGKQGKNGKGENKYTSKCKTCTKPKAETRARNYKFNCKHCGTPSDHYDKRYTTFCSRECSFAHDQGKEKYEPTTCKKCNIPLIGRGKNLYCASCKNEIEKEKAEKEKQFRLERELERERIRLEKERESKEKDLQAKIAKDLKRMEYENKLNKVCTTCNIPFKAKSIQAKLCPTCRKLREFYRDITRGKRSASILPIDITRFDADISLDKLIERDKNICHICFKKCDKTDFSYHENGAYMAGENHPSVDHIIPLANGGTHTWDNVKLAHKRCNSMKSDYDIDDSKKQLQFFL